MRNFFNSFSEINWLDFQDKINNKIDNEIKDCSDDYILNVNEEDFISYLVDKYSYEPLTIDVDSEEVETPKEIRIDLSQFRDAYSIYGRYRNGYSITISYLYKGSGILFKICPNPHILNSYKIAVDDYSKRVSFDIKVFSQNVSEFQREKESVFERAFCNVKNVNSNLKSYNDSLLGLVRQKFQKVKQQRLSKTNFFAAIKVKKSTTSPTTYGIPIVTKREPIKPQCTKSKTFFPEPCLDMSSYDNIIAELNQLGSSMEQKPSLYKNKDEEGLRDFFLTMLETRFKGATATGETFNHGGKTDILLKNASDGSNLFIAECKFWRGQKHFKDAINQLFDRYLTWRDSKVALIIFVNGSNFTNVLNSIKKSVCSHPYYIKLLGEHNKTSISYLFRFPKDEQKEVYLEVIAFNFDKNY